ncbi:hypothetical protein MRB53_023980 [Persea americana]|uniref:Uncharacterized protein n=1 Tax=Persea americana TaxID=3435 RepID=A0ACC2LAV6_PERAE|nr:hypothetical protein MRB53_023980 [Persea americana]
MEGDSRKRAACVSLSLQDDDDDEDEKMERFFSLIRNIRATKEGLMKEANESKPKKPKEERAAVWIPTFECEDFMQEINFKAPAIFSNSSKNSSTVKENQENTRAFLD